MTENKPTNKNQDTSYNKTNTNITKIDKSLLEDQLKCPICNSLYDSNSHIPFVISCGHTFCKQCIFNYPNNNCPLDNNSNAFKMHIRNIQLEIIIDKINSNNNNNNNKDIQNRKMIYIKPDIKRNKNSNNFRDDENIIINLNKIEKDCINKIRGRSINQRSRSNKFNLFSPENNTKINYNKKSPNDNFRSTNLNNLVSNNKIEDNDILIYSKNDKLISFKYNNKNNDSFDKEKKLNEIEDNYDFKLEDEKIDDMIISETIGTIPINEEKSFTNLSIREDFNDLLLSKNEIYKVSISNNK